MGDVVSNAIFHLDGQTLYLVEDGDLWLSTHDENEDNEDTNPDWLPQQEVQLNQDFSDHIFNSFT